MFVMLFFSSGRKQKQQTRLEYKFLLFYEGIFFSREIFFLPTLNLISIYLYTYKTLITLIVCLYDCLFEALRTNPGYGMAALISNNLLNLISGTVILLRSS